MREVVLASGVRTAFGSFGGTLKDFWLPELGGIVIQGNNPEDVRLAEEIIKFIQEQFAGSEPQIVLVPLLYGDATSITATLSQLFQRVQITATGNVSSAARPATGQPAAPRRASSTPGWTGTGTASSATRRASRSRPT